MIRCIQINTVIQKWACVKHTWYPWSGLVSSIQMLQYSHAMLNSTCVSSACSHEGGHRAVRCWHPFHSQHQQHCGLGDSFAVSSYSTSFLKGTTIPAIDLWSKIHPNFDNKIMFFHCTVTNLVCTNLSVFQLTFIVSGLSNILCKPWSGHGVLYHSL